MVGSRLLGVLVVLVALTVACEASACSCERVTDEATAFRRARARATVLFRGRVEDLQAEGNEHRVTFRVSETFKGKAQARRTVTTSAFGAACGVTFASGGDYLVYAEGSEARGLSTYSCSRTTPVDQATAELDHLRGGASPFFQDARRGCTRCDLEATARFLACPGPGRCAPVSPAAQALEPARPFWTPATARPSPEGPVLWGVSLDGRPFQLELRRTSPEDNACEHHVARRWCERLAPTRVGTTPGLECVGPSAAADLCDERRTLRPRIPSSDGAGGRERKK